MPFLLDTNVLSELRKGDRTSKNVKAWQKSHAASDHWISVISLMEVQIGIVRALRHDPPFARILADWYDTSLVVAYMSRTLIVDRCIAEKRAEFERLRTLNHSDALIAATADVKGMVLATRNTKDFDDLGIPLVNPWEHPID
jgi:predicted nucleic acid-binding protein